MRLGLQNAKTKTAAKFPRKTISRAFSKHLVWSCWCGKWSFLWVKHPALSVIIHRSYPRRMLKLLLRPFVNWVTHFSGTTVTLWPLDTKGPMPPMVMSGYSHLFKIWGHVLHAEHASCVLVTLPISCAIQLLLIFLWVGCYSSIWFYFSPKN